MAIISKLYNTLREYIQPSGLSGETELSVRCIGCSRKEQLLNFIELKRADHICKSGQHLVFNIGDRQISAYTHHAIVKTVDVLTPSTAIVTLIHFYTTAYDQSIRIQATTELLDLLYHEINIIRYRHPTLKPETIISRAEELVEQNKRAKYSVLFYNCEHFCNWCCVGSEDSPQADYAWDVLRAILAGAVNICGKILKDIFERRLLSINDLSETAVCGFQTILIAVRRSVPVSMAIGYLIYTIYRHYKLHSDLRAGKICSPCCLHKKQEIWFQFGTYCGIQASGLGLLSQVIATGASCCFKARILTVCSILSSVRIWAIPKLWQLFCSPFQGRLMRVTSLEIIRTGDVISFGYWNISHDGIVTAVKIYPHTRKKQGQVKVIHYSLPTLISRRTVVEETIEIDLGKHLILGHDYTGYKVHQPEIVLDRARQRLGETTSGLMSSRSCHFCNWAKVNEDMPDEDVIVPQFAQTVMQYLKEVDPKDTISNLPSQSLHVDHKRGRKHASKAIGTAWARIRDDIKPGQIVEFKYGRFWHKAVSTKVSFDEHVQSKVYVTVVHYGRQRKVCEETFEFNLNNQDVWIYNYHPFYRYIKDDVIRRARARIGEGNYNRLRHRSSYLAREILVKDNNSVVTDIDEIKRGDVITFYYWLFGHDAVVTKVTPGDTNTKTTGNLRIIHYAFNHLFAVPTVKEEYIPVDLKKGLVYLKGYDGYITYPTEMVVKRARSRVGEQRFSLNGNTSSDLAHWAKVVQTPVVVSKSQTQATQSSGIEDDTYLLVPKAGEQCEDFQYFRANSWSDLYPGVIVEYRYYWIWHQGILSYKDEKRKTIKVIHYGADHLFASRTVMEDSMQLDLRYDNIWIYRGHPRQCFKAGKVLENARNRLGEQRWKAGNRSWDFCKDCVLKKRSKEVSQQTHNVCTTLYQRRVPTLE